MANINQTLVTASTPTIVAKAALKTLKEKINLPRFVNKDYDTEVAQFGQTIDITQRGTLSVNDKAVDTAVTLQTPSDSKVSVSLDKHKEVSFLIEDPAKAFAKPDILAGYTNDASDRIAEQLDSDISSLFSSFSSSVGTAGTDIDRTVITNARQALTENLAPDSPRYMVITAAQEQALLDNDKFSFANYTGSDEAFRRGNLGVAFGFDTFVNTQLPNGAGSPAGKVNFAFTRDAIVLVTRGLGVNQVPGGGVFQSLVTDEDTGIVIRSTVSYNPDQLGIQVTLDMLYGVAQLRDEFGVQVLSQD